MDLSSFLRRPCLPLQRSYWLTALKRNSAHWRRKIGAGDQHQNSALDTGGLRTRTCLRKNGDRISISDWIATAEDADLRLANIPKGCSLSETVPLIVIFVKDASPDSVLSALLILARHSAWMSMPLFVLGLMP